MSDVFNNRLRIIIKKHSDLVNRKNTLDTSWTNGVYDRYVDPVVTDEHVPLFWRYDLDSKTNPLLMERQGINAVLNPGAIEIDGKIRLVCRVEGIDRKSFFAVAESPTGIDSFKFWDHPITMPQTEVPDVNVYDMRCVKHEDGWIYGLFCTERKDPKAPPGDLSSAIAQCGVARTHDMVSWERLDDFKSSAAQQRNVTLHPEFFNGKYAFYTRPQDSFIDAGSGGGIGWGLSESIEHSSIGPETIIDPRAYHTIKESKNGIGPSPIKTARGWLNIAHGVRNTAAGLRYVVYAYLCDLKEPYKVVARPGGYLIAPFQQERLGDVSNVIFCNGAVARANGDLFIYYASSDTRIHVAKTTVEKMLDYVVNTPEDPLRSYDCVQQRNKLIDKNLEILKTADGALKEAGE